jgi:anti-sigma B factor antagonist
LTVSASSRQVNGVTVVDLCGSITVEEGSAVLRRTLQNLAEQGSRKIVLNLSGVTEVDHAGLGEMVCALTSLHQAGGDMRLLNLSAEVRELLEITKLYSVFAVAGSEASAVKALRS